MTRVLWWDTSVGCAGDMLLGSLLDAGADLERVRAAIAAVGLDEVTLDAEPVQRGSFRALRAVVRVRGAEPDAGAGPEHGHAPDDHDHPHGHDHPHPHHHDHPHAPHRPWRDIRSRLETAALPERARHRALSAYERLARAEARLHGVPVDDVELHEVGAADAIADVVGVAAALEDLGVDRIVATPLPLGTGAVRGAHGRIPLPAPATLEVLKDWPVVTSPWPGEWVTPTGAALVAALAQPGGVPPMTIRATGHGAGRRDPPQVANLVRAVLGEATAGPTEEVEELVANLDDMTPELVASLVPGLLAAGALDAWVVPVQAKKGRTALVLHALARPAEADRLAERILRSSSTLGVRRFRGSRSVLDRWIVEVTTPYGTARVKVGGRHGAAWHAAPEHDDVARLARAADVPEQEVWQAVVAAWRGVG